MRTTILFFILTLVSFNFSAQESIDFKYSEDFEEILKETKNETSELNFKKLFPRFIKGDTTLTNYEVLALKINYTENEKYWPYQDVELEREIWKLNENEDYLQALKKCDTLLFNNPFSILGNREKGYALSKTGQIEESKIYENRLDLSVTSVLVTGDGTSYESSWFTLSPLDGQWIIRLMFRKGICSMGSGRDENGNFHDILGIELDDEESCPELYFNIEPASNRMFGPDGLKMENN